MNKLKYINLFLELKNYFSVQIDNDDSFKDYLVLEPSFKFSDGSLVFPQVKPQNFKVVSLSYV